MFRGNFNPKAYAFKILQSKYDEVAQQEKQIWKIIFGLKMETHTKRKVEQAKAQAPIIKIAKVEKDVQHKEDQVAITNTNAEEKKGENTINGC